MTVTVANFAAELGVTNARLLEQLNAAGISKNTAEDVVTEDDKHIFSLRCAVRTEREAGSCAALHSTAPAPRKSNSL